MVQSRMAAAIEIRKVPTATIESVWGRWGTPVVTPYGVYEPADLQGLALFARRRTPAALVTWCAYDERVEIVTVEALEEGLGYGALLLERAEAHLREAGHRRLVVVTTNDNLRAFGFYARRGYRLVRLHPDFMDRVRALKPEIPNMGECGIRLRDAWELEKRL